MVSKSLRWSCTSCVAIALVALAWFTMTSPTTRDSAGVITQLGAHEPGAAHVETVQQRRTLPGTRRSGDQQEQDQRPLPPLRLIPDVFDAGYIGPEELIDAEFRVYNPTRETMIIDGFTTSCKCTAPVIEDRIIPPGEYVNVSAVVDLRGTLGPINKSFTLLIRGYERRLTCTIKAVMGTKVKVEPVRLSRLQGRITLSATDDRPFTPLALHNEDAQVNFRAVDPTESGAAVTWLMDYRLAGTSADTCLLIETDHPEAPIITPRLYTAQASRPEIEYIKQRLEVYSVRTHALLSELPEGESEEVECQIRRPRDKQNTSLSVRTGLEGLDAEIVKIEDIEGDTNPDFITRVYTVKVTNNGVEEDAIMTPLYFQTPDDFETRLWLLGLAREAGTELDTDEDQQGG